MKAHQQNKRANFILKWTGAFSFSASLAVQLTLIFAPFSFGYLCMALAIGMVFTLLTLLSWKLESCSALNWLVAIPATLLVGQGQTWAESWAFPNHGTHGLDLWLVIQYLALVFLMFFGLLDVFRKPIVRFLFGMSAVPAVTFHSEPMPDKSLDRRAASSFFKL
jgi:hypothetical protein